MELRVELPENRPLSTFEQIDFGEKYPNHQVVFRINADLEVNSQGATFSGGRQEAAGFAYATKSGGRTIHAMPTNFTYLWADPYTTWEDFSGEAEAAWAEYKKVAEPFLVTSIGTRFVNVIRLPEKPVEIKDYLRISVDIPSALPQGLRNMFTQVDIPMDQYGVTCTITNTIVDPTEEHPGGGLLLDIDVRAPVKIDTLDEGFDGEIRAKLDTLRQAKNLVFEACITDATRERIN